MEKILQELIGKDCIIGTLKGDFTGNLLKIDQTYLILEKNATKQFVNLEYVISARQVPLNKKGKKKLFYV